MAMRISQGHIQSADIGAPADSKTNDEIKGYCLCNVPDYTANTRFVTDHHGACESFARKQMMFIEEYSVHLCQRETKRIFANPRVLQKTGIYNILSHIKF
jgi:hypothetical protein